MIKTSSDLTGAIKEVAWELRSLNKHMDRLTTEAFECKQQIRELVGCHKQLTSFLIDEDEGVLEKLVCGAICISESLDEIRDIVKEAQANKRENAL